MLITEKKSLCLPPSCLQETPQRTSPPVIKLLPTKYQGEVLGISNGCKLNCINNLDSLKQSMYQQNVVFDDICDNVEKVRGTSLIG